MKSINPIQKYPHIIESYACILKIIVIMFLLCEASQSGGRRTKDEGRCEVEEFKEPRLINSLISLGMCSTPKELK